MWNERCLPLFRNIIIELLLKQNTRQTSPMKTVAQKHSVQNTFQNTRSNMAGGMALISSEILCLMLLKSAGRAWNTLFFK
jgi:hypothetical protein